MRATAARAVIFLGPGGQNTGSIQRLRQVAQAAQARHPDLPVVAAFVVPGKSANAPSLAEAVERLAAQGARQVAVLPFMLEWSYPDQYDVPDLLADVAREYPALELYLGRHLGGAPQVESLLDWSLDGVWALPPVAAATVRDVADIAGQSPVTQATVTPSTLPRMETYEQHLLLCTGRRCLEQGSSQSYLALTALLAEHGLDGGARRVKVTRTKCLSPCAAAPVVCHYPSATYYAQMDAAAMPELVERVLAPGGGDLPGRTFRAEGE